MASLQFQIPIMDIYINLFVHLSLSITWHVDGLWLDWIVYGRSPSLPHVFFNLPYVCVTFVFSSFSCAFSLFELNYYTEKQQKLLCIKSIFLFWCCSVLSCLQILAPLPIGFAVFLVHLATIPITGTGINPARSLGAAIIYNKDHAWDDHVSILMKNHL